MAKQPTYNIWQWNCRSYANKKAVLTQYIRDKNKPDIIILQESHGFAKLAGYRAIGCATGETTTLTTLVRKDHTVIQHDTKIRHIDNILIELIPHRKTHASLFVLNIYSNPKHKKHRFGTLFKRALNIAGSNSIIIGGDFNAPYTAWGYSYAHPKGRDLWLDTQNEG